MKNYKKVKMVAKNAPSGSYAAGCPAQGTGGGYFDNWFRCERVGGCKECERRQ